MKKATTARKVQKPQAPKKKKGFNKAKFVATKTERRIAQVPVDGLAHYFEDGDEAIFEVQIARSGGGGSVWCAGLTLS